MEPIESIVCRAVAEHFGWSKDSIKPETTLLSLGADDLDYVDLILLLEEQCGIDLPDDLVCKTVGGDGNPKTVQDYINIVNAATESLYD